MTATRERQSAPTPDNGAPQWAERSAFGSRGVPLWGAVLIAAGGTALGAVIDLILSGTPGLIFKIGLIVGCLASVALVRRGNLFGPMVQPPLVATVVMPILVVLFGGGTNSSGMMGKALSVVQPLIAGFPMMAITTAASLAFGLVRMFWLQRADQDDIDISDTPTKKRRPVKPPKETGQDAARQPRKRSADGERRPAAGPRGERGERGERNKARRPASEQGGRPRDGAKRDPRPERGDRATPPARGGERGRGTPPGRTGSGGRGQPGRAADRGEGRPRPAPGRGRPEPKPDPQRRPRKPRRDDDFFG
ncbi:hypothetical protein GCM10027271_18090 [Saccharopolyspora gloriosae]|uniref:DUF6542 domain-containing protein n=1 Tax=Saccharopolyspora gloriosae TaxID=455344 RepID=A0A840NDE9_9PSEU|nr:DUF6542 domain-containing protein [Saccharopolyspora gloriosae]MBB5067359.1 hypothetical protein [Saccharopolyspora gloriosae]